MDKNNQKINDERKWSYPIFLKYIIMEVKYFPIILFVIGPSIYLYFNLEEGFSVQYFYKTFLIILIGIPLYIWLFLLGKDLENYQLKYLGKSYSGIRPKKCINIIEQFLIKNKFKFQKKLNIKIGTVPPKIEYDAIFMIDDYNINIKIRDYGHETFISIGKVNDLNKGTINNIINKIDLNRFIFIIYF